MNQEKYIRLVLKKLKCSGRKKNDIKKELESDIISAKENGESFDGIMARMGTPELLASEFNDNFSPEELKAYKRKKLGKILGILAGTLLILLLAALYILPKNYPLEQRDTFVEAKVIARADEVILAFSEKDYDAIREMCASDRVKNVLSDEILSDARALFPDEWGAFVAYGNAYTSEVVQMGNSMAVIQINATYEYTAVTYTLMFDENMKLCGFYVK
ncbi:MAG: DUF3887 domain-containing protein [Lachnospiraceae bacterium]|nr:DUF3887 domain-containing protein [Lachnospiraceae bacterium]